MCISCFTTNNNLMLVCSNDDCKKKASVCGTSALSRQDVLQRMKMVRAMDCVAHTPEKKHSDRVAHSQVKIQKKNMHEIVKNNAVCSAIHKSKNQRKLLGAFDHAVSAVGAQAWDPPTSNATSATRASRATSATSARLARCADPACMCEACCGELLVMAEADVESILARLS